MADQIAKSFLNGIVSATNAIGNIVTGNGLPGNASVVKGAILVPYKETVAPTPAQIAANQSVKNNKNILQNLFGF